MVQARFPKYIKRITSASFALVFATYTIYMSYNLKRIKFPHETDAVADAVTEAMKVINTKEVWLEPDELKLIVKYLVGKYSYLEWGSGGSTINFPRLVHTAASIEHDEQWCENMPLRIKNANITNIAYNCVPTKHHPGTDGTYEEFREYVDRVLKFDRKIWHFVFIDGRARVPCAIRILPFLENHSIVAIHDFQRVQYHKILDYYDIIDQIHGVQNHQFQHKGLVILRRKSKFNYIQNNHTQATNLIHHIEIT